MLGALLIVAAATALAADPPSFAARKDEVRMLLDRGEFDTALSKASAINREWPDDVAGYQLVAEAQLGLQKWADAEKTLQWMLDLRIGKADAEGWLLIARFREASGDPEGALDAANLSYQRLKPEQNREAATLLTFLAKIHLQNDKPGLAVELANEALKRVPNFPAARAILEAARPAPRVKVTGKSVDERISMLEASAKKLPQDLDVRDRLAGAYLQKMRETADGSYVQRAQQQVTAILKADPENYSGRRRQIEIDLQFHRFQSVIDQAQTLIAKQVTDPSVWGLLGDALMERGEYDRAADAYQRMTDLRPGFASYNRIAFYRFVTGDAAGAIEIMRKAIQLGADTSENLAWGYSELGTMLWKTGEVDAAEQTFMEALSVFPGFHHAAAGMGYVLTTKGRLDDAVKFFLQAQARAPFPEYAGALAKLYRKLGREDLAGRQIALLDLQAKLDQAAGEPANRTLAIAFADLDHDLPRAVSIARAELQVRQDVYSWDALAWTLFQSKQFREAGTAMRKALSQNTPEPSFHRHAARIFESLGETEEARSHTQGEVPWFDTFVSRF